MENTNIRIFSLNCSGVSNMIPLLKEVCMQHDVLLLQETWLTPYNIDFLDNVHEDLVILFRLLE